MEGVDELGGRVDYADCIFKGRVGDDGGDRFVEG